MAEAAKQHAQPAPEPAKPAAPPRERWMQWVALTTTVLAVCAAISALKGGGYSTKVQLSTTQEANRWSHFQAKSIKQHAVELHRDDLELAQLRRRADRPRQGGDRALRPGEGRDQARGRRDPEGGGRAEAARPGVRPRGHAPPDRHHALLGRRPDEAPRHVGRRTRLRVGWALLHGERVLAVLLKGGCAPSPPSKARRGPSPLAGSRAPPGAAFAASRQRPGALAPLA